MATCPNCGEKDTKSNKTWKYGIYQVQAFVCQNCNTKFREYYKSGKYAFTLKLQKGNGMWKKEKGNIKA
jgi:transposase-like protein